VIKVSTSMSQYVAVQRLKRNKSYRIIRTYALFKIIIIITQTRTLLSKLHRIASFVRHKLYYEERCQGFQQAKTIKFRCHY